MAYVKISFHTPFKFHRYQSNGIGFDDKWTRDQRFFFEMPIYYKQKWNIGDKTKIQMESTSIPDDLKYINHLGQVIKNTSWTSVVVATSYRIYEVEVDFSTLPNNSTYFLYQLVQSGLNFWPYMSEPIAVATNWPNTLLYTYSHHFNDYDMAWTTGIELKFRCESGIVEFDPVTNRTTHVNQTADVSTLNGVPSRSFKLYVGLATGVPPWILDLFNRIFSCSRVLIGDMRFQMPEGGKIEKNFIKGNRMMGALIDIVPQFNNMSLEYNDGVTGGKHGIIAAYNIDTSFFGKGSIIPILDIEKQD